MAITTLEAYDLIRHAESLLQRLLAAQSALAQKRGFKLEKGWMAAAVESLQIAVEPTQGLLDRICSLPELAEVRDEYAATFQGLWVDVLERLLAGFTFHAGNRAPVIEALFPHQKFLALRRASNEAILDYAKEFERRLKSSYVCRMLSQSTYSFTTPVLEQLATAYTKWRSLFDGNGISEIDAIELRKELVATAKRLDLVSKQAKLLAEAALLPIVGMFEETGLAAKMRKRPSIFPKSQHPSAKQEDETVKGDGLQDDDRPLVDTA